MTHYRKRGILGDQRGIALIMAIGMLAVLSLLGVAVLSSSTREVQATGADLAAYEAFFTADRAVEYATSRGLLLSIDGIVNLKSDTTHEAIINVGFSGADSGHGVLKEGTVVDAGPGELPTKFANRYGTDFGANFYFVSIETEGPEETEVRIDSQIARLFKNDDDTIFRTTGGG